MPDCTAIGGKMLSLKHWQNQRAEFEAAGVRLPAPPRRRREGLAPLRQRCARGRDMPGRHAPEDRARECGVEPLRPSQLPGRLRAASTLLREPRAPAREREHHREGLRPHRRLRGADPPPLARRWRLAPRRPGPPWASWPPCSTPASLPEPRPSPWSPPTTTPRTGASSATASPRSRAVGSRPARSTPPSWTTSPTSAA